MTDYTIPIDDELKRQLESCSSEFKTNLLDAVVDYLRQRVKQEVAEDEDDDWDWDAPYTDEEEFYGPENVKYILEGIKQFEEGKVVTVTLDELKAMVNEKI
jgi:predicted transcriptional regulator